MTTRLAVMAIGLLCWTMPAYSHHNSISQFDLDKEVIVEGIVGSFKMVNPHALIFFDVVAEKGQIVHWVAEGDAASVLLRRGWSRDQLKPGTFIKVRGHPSRDGSPVIEWLSIILPDGTELLGGNGLPEERERTLEKRRQEQLEQQTELERQKE